MVKKRLVALAATISLLGVAETGHADVKVVSQVNVSKAQASGSAPASRTVTAYFKNDNARIESGSDNTIWLYDYAAHTVSILDPARKTYYVKPLPVAGQGNGGQGKLNQFVRINVTGGIQPVPRGAAATVAGVPTKPYSIRADVGAQPKNSAMGSFLGAGGVSVHVEGQFQGAAASLVLPAVTAERLMTLTQQLLAQGRVPGPLMDDLLKLKVVPMKVTVVVTPSASLTAAAKKQSSGRFAGRGQSAEGSNFPSGPTTISTEVLSLDEKTTLDSALFVVPAGYQKVEPPKERSGGFGGRFGSGTL